MLNQIKTLDHRFYQALTKLKKPTGLTIVMKILSLLGENAFIWLVLSGFLTWQNNNFPSFYLMLILQTGQFALVSLLIKRLVKRPRPNYQQEDPPKILFLFASYSFPSGHTAASFTAWPVLSYYFPRYTFYFISLALLISFSRLYLAKHYFSDILAGIVLGLLLSGITLFLSNLF